MKSEDKCSKFEDKTCMIKLINDVKVKCLMI